jgi:hypothetical protein
MTRSITTNSDVASVRSFITTQYFKELSMHQVSVFQRFAVPAVQRVVLGVASCLLVAAPAAAQPKAVAISQSTVTVTPTLANAGTPRKISIESTWPNSCVPAIADTVFVPSAQLPVLVIRLKVNSHAKSCVKGATPFKQEVSFTPFKNGEMPLYVLTSEGGFVAQSKIVSEPVFDF